MEKDNKKFAIEIKEHLVKDLIPFWENLKDTENGGYYGYMDYNLNINKTFEKGCILNSRILWLFSSAYEILNKP
ncbi:MAG: N-acylglucosamine 2-epimerase, partial [Eubacteriales bacterium]|nr:N-acylglucosamine 2-epimerase [Eubacteriales bacterium]